MKRICRILYHTPSKVIFQKGSFQSRKCFHFLWIFGLPESLQALQHNQQCIEICPWFLPGLCLLLSGLVCSSFNLCWSSSSSWSSLKAKEGKQINHSGIITHKLCLFKRKILLSYRLSMELNTNQNFFLFTHKVFFFPTYSHGPDCGNGITFLPLPTLTVPAICTMRSCHL